MWLFILIAIGVTIWLAILIRDIWDKQKERKLLQYAAPIVTNRYHKFIQVIIKQYPLIPFEFSNPEEIITNLYRIPGVRFKSVYKVVEQALTPLIEEATDAFTRYSPDITNTGNVPSHIAPTQFWKSEEKFRTTSNSQNPPDWQERRMIVYERDNKRCRRCGINVLLKRCHIHHLLRRSKGGDHSLQNLITLCKDCHKLMEGHEDMKAIQRYYVSSRGTLHTPRCYHAIGSKAVWDSVPRLVERQGFIPCRKCKPWNTYHPALAKWKPSIKKFATEELLSLLNDLRNLS